MTVKIIKEAPKFKPIQLTCPHCTAMLEASDPSDFLRESYSDFRESWDYALITCPSCRCNIQVESNNFPKHIYDGLKRTGR